MLVPAISQTHSTPTLGQSMPGGRTALMNAASFIAQHSNYTWQWSRHKYHADTETVSLLPESDSAINTKKRPTG